MLREEKNEFFVWTKNGHKPRFFHCNLEAAETEAQRLAALHPNRKFLVGQFISKFSEAGTHSTQEVSMN